MDAIVLESLSKNFKNYYRGKGLMGSLRTLFSTKYSEVHAVKNISLAIPNGQLIGYIGPNGAGKSTTIKMMTGILQPSGGKISVLDRNPFKQRSANNFDIGVVFGQRTQLWWDIPVRESFRFLQAIYHVSEKQYKTNISRFDELLNIEDYMDVSLRKLSLGQRMACDLAASFLHNPKVVYLDEPTIGLDPLMKERIRGFIADVNQSDETTIILTTHDLMDIEKLAQRVVIIDQGQILFDGPLQEIRTNFGDEQQLKVDLTTSLSQESLTAIETSLQNKVSSLEFSENCTEGCIRFDRNIISSPALYEILHNILSIREFSLQEAPIESIIQRIYQGTNKT